MKTRSSRFFVVLLHLLGVPNHHLPSWYYDYLASSSSDRASFYSGIRGVHPHSIVLERLDLREVGGLDGVEWLSTTESTDPFLSSTRIAKEPFWLQDAQDGQCLGPSGGFSECGDATLWFILRKSTDRKSLRMSGPFGIEVVDQVNHEEPYRYALQIVGNDYLQPGSTSSSPASATTSISSLTLSWRQKRQQRRQRDCLVPSKSRDDTSSLELGSCAKQNTAWSWRVDSQGYLYLPKDSRSTKGRECLRRTQSSSAILSSCEEDNVEQPQRLVQFSLVRYHATSNSSLSSSSSAIATTTTTTTSSTPPSTSEHHHASSSSSTASSKRSLTPPHPSGNNKGGLPSNRDIAHSHASGPVLHSPIFEMNLAGRPLLSNIPSLEARKQSNSSPFAALKDSNPILFHSAASEQQQKKPAPLPASSPNPVKLRKMEMNPYIAASQDEKWVDPLTGLEYRTDLCHYLGHDRKEYGRHTLVGVGQYMKTMLKIKVRGKILM
jgi:hypothetical protein